MTTIEKVAGLLVIADKEAGTVVKIRSVGFHPTGEPGNSTMVVLGEDGKEYSGIWNYCGAAAPDARTAYAARHLLAHRHRPRGVKPAA